MGSKPYNEALLSGDYLLTASQAASLLNISRSKLYALVRRGLIPCVHIDRSTRFLARDVRAYMRQQRAAARKDGE